METKRRRSELLKSGKGSPKLVLDSNKSETSDFEMLPSRSLRKQKFSKNMSDIIKKELQSETDESFEDLDMEPMQKKKKNISTPKFNQKRQPKKINSKRNKVLKDIESDECGDIDGNQNEDSKQNLIDSDSSNSEYKSKSNPNKTNQQQFSNQQSIDENSQENQTQSKKKKVMKLGSPNSPYYKQFYRKAWENVPEFKGWLAPVENNETRAFCVYCNKEMVAHSFSLMKHVACSKHQRNAEKIYIMNSESYVPKREFNNYQQIKKENDTSSLNNPNAQIFITQNENSICSLLPEQQISDENLLHENIEIVLPEDDQASDEETDMEKHIAVLDMGIDDAGEEDDDSTDEMEKLIHIPSKSISTIPSSSSISLRFLPVSTHVLDSNLGLPIPNLEISLYKLVDGRWRLVREQVTNAGGRASNFIQENDPNFSCGRYKFHFHIYKYFQMKKISTIFPYIEIAFDLKSLTDHLHIPLIVSANGYHFYKGSAA